MRFWNLHFARCRTAYMATAISVCSFLLFEGAAWRPDPSASHASPLSAGEPLVIQSLSHKSSTVETLHVVSWNIDRGANLPVIEEDLARQHPDLCLLQEVDRFTKRTGGSDVASSLAGFLHLSLAYGNEFTEISQELNGKPAYIGQATLTALPIKRARILRFATQSGFWKPRPWIPSSLPLMQRREGGRIALVTDLQFRGHSLVVYNVHLESRSWGPIQARQLDEILSDLKSYPPDTPVILGGDFNSKYFPGTLLHKLEREGFRSVAGEHIERSHTIALALDWIFVRGPLQVEDGGVRREIKGSDHYPVVASLHPRSGNPSR